MFALHHTGVFPMGSSPAFHSYAGGLLYSVSFKAGALISCNSHQSVVTGYTGVHLSCEAFNLEEFSIMAESPSPWSMVTPMLLFSCFCLLTGDLLFGYDTGSFGGILANPGFLRQFGSFDASKQDYVFTSNETSLLSSLPFIGKFVGCLLAGPAIERYGHRLVFYMLSAISIIGVVLEITSAGEGAGTGRFAQFIVGRCVVYMSVGLVEVDVTTYQSEIVPASFRGLVVVSLQLFLNMGSVIATGINKGFASESSATGWKTVTGVQFIFPALITACTFFIPDSPRWLLSEDRQDEAICSLRRLRPKRDNTIEDGCEKEIVAIKAALREDVHKAPLSGLVRGTNLRRTILVVVFYFFQQTTGSAFVSTYQTTFYKTNGYAANAFTYPVINGCLSFVSVMPLMYIIDKLGRRGSLMLSYFFQAFWMFLLAGLGSKNDRTPTQSNTVVAAFMLYSFSYNCGGGSIPYLLGGEIPNAALREKTQSLGTSWNVVWAFVTNYAIPYMINTIHFQVGWVFGGISTLALVYTFFFLPETKGRSLEDIDALFEKANNPFRPNRVEYAGADSHITGESMDDGKLTAEHVA
ncbi:putative sugar transporter [Xylariomycetidae sp. FL0641]|nr:putative sugar transporter [Xylariomycetidae sp. FL0641]